jgi:hypothetical protein
VKNNKFTLLILVLSVLLMAVLNIYSWMKSSEREEKISGLESEIEKWKDDYFTLDANLISLNDLNVMLTKELELYRNPDNRAFFLQAIHALAEDAKAILIWNKKDYSILFSCEGLPKVSEKSNYQLWVLRNGKYFPVINLPRLLSSGFIKLETIIESADGFIITLEESSKNPPSVPSETYLSGNL